MIKLPEPYMIQRDFVNAYVNHNLYTESQLKQAVRDAYEDVLGIDWFELMRNNFDKERSEHIAESIETAIHALIKEI